MSHIAHFAWRALGATAAGLASFGAAASVITVEFSGTVGFTGWDTTGVFGKPNTDLFGALFTASFVFDSAVGSHAVGPYSEELVGGPQVALSMPLLSGSMLINGVSAPYSLDGWAYLLVQNSGSPRKDLQVVVGFYTPPLSDDVFNVVVNSPDIESTFAASYQTSNVNGGGMFRMQTYDPSQATFVRRAEGQLEVKKVTFRNGDFPPGPNDVPEPAALSLCAVGLAALIAAGRRRAGVAPRLQVAAA